MLPSKKIEDFASGCLDALLAKYDESSKAKMHQGPLMPSLPSMNLPNSYFGKLRISPTLRNGQASTLSLACPFLCAGSCEHNLHTSTELCQTDIEIISIMVYSKSHKEVLP